MSSLGFKKFTRTIKKKMKTKNINDFYFGFVSFGDNPDQQVLLFDRFLKTCILLLCNPPYVAKNIKQSTSQYGLWRINIQKRPPGPKKPKSSLNYSYNNVSCKNGTHNFVTFSGKETICSTNPLAHRPSLPTVNWLS
jgi:hypothetical protein